MPETVEVLISHVNLSDILLTDNIRKVKIDDSLKELAQSINEQGLIQSLVLKNSKEHNGKYDLICGQRRLAAINLNHKVKPDEDPLIPARVLEFADNAEITAMQLSENTQRENLTPFEEAKAYKAMLDQTGDINVTAGKAARSRAYILRRLSLLQLIAPFRKALENNIITIGHALAIVPFTKEQQFQLLDNENFCEVNAENKEITACNWHVEKLESQLGKIFILSLDAANFNGDDPKLVKKAGTCSVCPHNTLRNELFSDNFEGAFCSNPKCYYLKTFETIVRRVRQLRQDNIPFKLLTAGFDYSESQIEEIEGVKVEKIADVQKKYRIPEENEKIDKFIIGIVVDSRHQKRFIGNEVKLIVGVNEKRGIKAEYDNETKLEKRKRILEKQWEKARIKGFGTVRKTIREKLFNTTDINMSEWKLVFETLLDGSWAQQRIVVCKALGLPLTKGMKEKEFGGTRDLMTKILAKIKTTEDAVHIFKILVYGSLDYNEIYGYGRDPLNVNSDLIKAAKSYGITWDKDVKRIESELAVNKLNDLKLIAELKAKEKAAVKTSKIVKENISKD
ncbi:MAG: ParB/RepB/Spo0J family partition protein [Bacteroidetes bacterium]|nr:ParB/RepB/Spo0J family partition protein [Bacteroidota bacterium]